MLVRIVTGMILEKLLNNLPTTASEVKSSAVGDVCMTSHKSQGESLSTHVFLIGDRSAAVSSG